MAQQTAVEWLVEQVKSKEWQDMFIWNKEEVFEQAKQMEKEQIVEDHGLKYCNLNEKTVTGKEYYKETYESS